MAENGSRSFLSEGFLIFGLTVIAYYGAYWFEVGYASHFGIPRQLVSIGPGNLILFVHAMVGAGVLIWLLGQSIASYFISPYETNWETHRSSGWPVALWLLLARCYLMLVGYFAVIAVIADSTWKEVLTFSLIPIAWYLVDLLFCLLIITGEVKRLEIVDRRVRDGMPSVPFLDLQTTPKIRLIKALVVTWILVILACHALGVKSARNAEEFMFTDAKEPEIVLRRYGDQFVLAPFEKDSATVVRRFRLVEAGGYERRFVVRRVGKISAAVKE